MKVVLYLTNRLKYKWPKEYMEELLRKLESDGHFTSIISDDTEEDVVKKELNHCDFFVGVPSPFDDLPTTGKRVTIRAASIKGEGPVSPLPCAGCIENLPEEMDCHFKDELCMKEVTPNDVLGHLC